MKKIICAICVICGCLHAYGDDKSANRTDSSSDKIVCDSNGKVVATISDTATGVTVRDANGKVIEHRERDGNKIIVRDSAGKVIREEEKARK